MDFFRSILADDPDPETLDNHEQSESDDRQSQLSKHQETEGDDDDDSTSNLNSSEDGSGGVAGGGLWSFGDLVKTLTTKSESVFETYRRDLKEFGTGLRKESDLFREVANRAVKELPSSIEVGTSAIDGVLKSTADIITQGKDALLQPSDVDDSDASESHTYSDRSSLNSRRYNRFDAQLNAIRSDTRTYCEDPDDLDDFSNWKLGFVVGDKKDEIEKLVGDNGDLVGMYAKLVPDEVDDATFWFRYFYKVHKLKQQEDMRAKLVKRSLSADDEEEELSWDVDEEEEEEEVEADQLITNPSKFQDSGDEIKPQSSKIVDEDKEMQTSGSSADKNNTLKEPKPNSGNESAVAKSEPEVKSSENLDLKVDAAGVKDSNVVGESNQTSLQEEDEDLDWDEIENDLGNNDGKKVSHGDTGNKADLCKRLSTAADEEDLSWDIEDEDDNGRQSKPGNK